MIFLRSILFIILLKGYLLNPFMILERNIAIVMQMEWKNHKNHLNHLKDYENTAIVSLKEAVNPLLSSVPEINRMAWTVKEACKTPADNLLSDESAAIMLFSMEVEPTENCFYHILNKTLQNKDQMKLEPWLLYLRLLTSSLSKLPPLQNQIVYRGSTSDLTNQYPIGTKFIWYEFLLCNKSVQLLEKFIGKSKIKTLFKIQCQTGKDIRNHSCFRAEDEVLIPGGSTFEVMSNYQESSDLCVILLEQIELITPCSLNMLSNSNPHLEQIITKAPISF